MGGASEGIGLTACLDDVLFAYRDGEKAIQSIKRKCADNRKPAPPRLLEENIEQAKEEIVREWKRGTAHFGRDYEEGDHIAIIALQQVTIRLQRSFLAALCGEHIDEFRDVIEATDRGRERTVASLIELKHRLLDISDHLTPTSSKSASTKASGKTQKSDVQEKQPIRSSQEIESSQLSPKARTWTREYSTPQPEGADTAAGADDESTRTRRHRHSSLLGVFKHHRNKSGDRRNSDVDELRRNSLPPQNSNRSNAQAGPSSSDASRRSFANDDGGLDTLKVGEEISHQRTRSVPPDWQSPSNSVSSERKLSTVQSGVQQTSGSMGVPQPNPENDFLGFCRGAWMLQNGDRRGMQKAKEFNDGWSQSRVHFLACSNSKCAFGGHIDLDIIWTKVWTSDNKGLKFRWPFLAKSHVCQTKVKDQQFSFKCLFCVFLGNDAPVIYGMENYLEHVSQEHRGRVLGDVILYRTSCVNNRVCEDSEDFDINLFPLTATQETQLRESSDVFSDDLLVIPPLKKSTTKDSTFSFHPWNEGLSDFHYDEEFEHIERERSICS